MKFYWNITIPVCVRVTYGCFDALRAEWSISVISWLQNLKYLLCDPLEKKLASPYPRVLWSSAGSKLDHRLNHVPGRDTRQSFFKERQKLHTWLPLPHFIHFLIHSTDIWTPICSSHNSSCLQHILLMKIWSHGNIQTLRSFGGGTYMYICMSMASTWGCVASLSALLLTFHFVTVKCYLAMGSSD